MAKYTLYYTNKFGQLANPNGSMYDNTKGNPIANEFESLESAKVEAYNFTENNPLLQCMIVPLDKSEEIEVVANDDALLKEHENNVFLDKNKKQRKKVMFGIFIVILILLILFLFA